MGIEDSTYVRVSWECLNSLDQAALKARFDGRPTRLINQLIDELIDPNSRAATPSLVGKVLSNLPNNYLTTGLGTRLKTAISLSGIFTRNLENVDSLILAISSALSRKDDSLATELLDLLPPGKIYRGLWQKAVTQDSTAVIKGLVSKGIDVQITGAREKTALHAAAVAGDVEAAVLLLERGISVNAQTDGDTALHLAVQNRHEKIVEILLLKGADPNIPDAMQNTAIHHAVETPRIVQLLINHGCDINRAGFRGDTALHASLGELPLKSAKILIRNGADLNAAERFCEWTPLHRALRKQAFTLAAFLLRCGADSLGLDYMSQHPLDIAEESFSKRVLAEAYKRFPGIIEILESTNNKEEFYAKLCAEKHKILASCRQDNANPLELALLIRKNWFWTLVLTAFKRQQKLEFLEDVYTRYVRQRDFLFKCLCDARGKTEVDWLLRQGFDMNKARVLNVPILYEQCLNNPRMAEFLLTKGGDIRIKGPDGETLLHAAAKTDSSLLKFLLAHRGDWQAESSEVNTVLHAAAKAGNVESIKLLLKAGFDPNAKDAFKQTPLHSALSNGSTEPMQALLNHPGIDVDAEGVGGSTPLHIACMHDFDRHATLLLSRGADPLHKNGKNITPFAEAQNRNAKNVLKVFFSKVPYILKLLEKEIPANLESRLIENYQKAVDLKTMASDPPALEIPLLLRSSKLAFLMIKGMSDDKFNDEIAALSEKYKKEDVDLVRLSIYTYAERHFSSSPGHRQTIPAPKDCDLSILLKQFEKINFSDPKEPSFRDPKNLKRDGHATTPEELKGFLAFLIDSVLKRRSVTATPPEGTLELETFYKKLEGLLKHIANFLTDSVEMEEKTTCLIDLAAVGAYCGMRWMGTAHQLYFIHVCNDLPLSFPERILKLLQELRLSTFFSLMRQDALQDPHAFAYYASMLVQEIGFYASETFSGYDDVYADKRVKKEDVLKLFYENYSVPRIISYVKTELEKMYLESNESKEIVVNWFIENVPDLWGVEEYTPCRELINALRNRKASGNEIKRALQKKQVFFPDSMDPQIFLDKMRRNDYLEAEVFVRGEDGLPTSSIRESAVVHLLKKIGVLVQLTEYGLKDPSGAGASKRQKLL